MRRVNIKCVECDSRARVKLNGYPHNLSYKLPVTWHVVRDDVVCSFNCANLAYEKLEDKSLGESILSGLYGALATVSA